MKYLIPLLLALASLVTAQCSAEPDELICYDYPGATTQDLDLNDVRTIAWYLRWYAHGDGNPKFWTMYTTHNATTTPAPLNGTATIAGPAGNVTAPLGATNGTNATAAASPAAAWGAAAPLGTGAVEHNGTVISGNASAPYYANTTLGAATGPTAAGGGTAAAAAAATGMPAEIVPAKTPVQDECLEWTVITRGSVMLLARLSSARNASVLYNDIAYSLDGVAGDWGEWTPRDEQQQQQQLPLDTSTKVLMDCHNSGGQIPVLVNATNPAYHSAEFAKANYATNGIFLKLVHTPTGMRR